VVPPPFFGTLFHADAVHKIRHLFIYSFCYGIFTPANQINNYYRFNKKLFIFSMTFLPFFREVLQFCCFSFLFRMILRNFHCLTQQWLFDFSYFSILNLPTCFLALSFSHGRVVHNMVDSIIVLLCPSVLKLWSCHKRYFGKKSSVYVTYHPFRLNWQCQ